ncbi:CDP-diacylglycerol--glycerol-3-phosphate 3-phosphatidyltransferase [Blastomonas sp.]|uniref:CDP-diacylglycerol--glycerol-3-phosphate 3-phosphatidyltransferase n=1 Tax=Blastomonas sp. TaxID=1909299 RepID=UPI003593A858
MLTLPNILTLSRIVTVPLLAALLWWPGWATGYLLGFVVYSLMGVTDYFDGYLARAQGAVSRLGIFLDPIADKIMVAAVILILCAAGNDRFPPLIAEVHVIAAMIILLREITVSGLREFLAGLQVSMPVSQLAKWKTTLQIVALGTLILAGGFREQVWMHDLGLATLWASAILTLVTGWDYLRVGLKHMD